MSRAAVVQSRKKLRARGSRNTKRATLTGRAAVSYISL